MTIWRFQCIRTSKHCVKTTGAAFPHWRAFTYYKARSMFILNKQIIQKRRGLVNLQHIVLYKANRWNLVSDGLVSIRALTWQNHRYLRTRTVYQSYAKLYTLKFKAGFSWCVAKSWINMNYFWWICQDYTH